MYRKLFAAFLVAVILLGGDLIWRVWAQTNTFCANNLACTVSAAWNFSAGLQSGGVNVLTNPVNLGTQVTGTLAGANYAAVNLAAGNVNGGVSGVLPGANHPATTSNCSGVQFGQGLNAGMTPVCTTPPTFVASGASHAVGYVPDPGASAGTTHFLREDATWATLPISGVSEALLSGGSTVLGSQVGEFGNMTFLVNGHTLTRLLLSYIAPGNQAAGCTTHFVVALWDSVAGSSVSTVTGANGVNFVDSGALSVAMTAAHRFDFKITTAEAGCTTIPNFQIVATYQ